ncbi:MAG: hypothetical protein ACRDD8_05810 [Bacteroidales bacterium]
MTYDDFKVLAIKHTTNRANAWGFGGSYTEKYTLQTNDGVLVYEYISTGYRHQRTPSIEHNYSYQNKPISKKEFMEVLHNINNVPPQNYLKTIKQ